MTALLFYRLSFYWLVNCRVASYYPSQLIFRALHIFTSYVPNVLHSIFIFHCAFYWNCSILDGTSEIHLEFMDDILWKRFCCQEEPKLNIATSCLCMRTAGKRTPFPRGLLDPASPPHQPWHKPQHWNAVAENEVSWNRGFYPLAESTLILAIRLQ